MTVQVWMRDRPQRELVGPLPANVELHLIAPDEPPPAAMLDAELIVPPVRSQALLEMLAEMPRLAVVQAASAGTDWLKPWIPAGVTLCNARGTRDVAVAEWVLAAVLCMEKRLIDLAARQVRHEWRPGMLSELAGKRALVVGYGSIGRRAANMLEALGMAVKGVASAGRPGVHGVEDLAGLLPSADIVVLLVPLTPDTRGLFDERMLSLMRPGALLVNASRGSVLDTTALLAQLHAERIRAALDVTDPEPLPSDHPLWDAPGTLITPHLAGDSPQAEERVYRLIGDQIRRYAQGEPLVNVEQLKPG
ncbi:MAG: 2-hydroxyacid dehydrogenase [Solirubrobacteraceae bacterium]